MSEFVLHSLLDSGFLPNMEKSNFTPTQKLDWLGFTWNLELGVIGVPRMKIEKIKMKIEKIMSERRSTARTLASILSKIISLIPTFGNICQLMTRHLCMAVCQRDNWDSHFNVPIQVKTELTFWLNNCNELPNVIVYPIQKAPERIIFTDTSSYAGAGFVVGNILLIAHNMFT